MTKQKSFSTIVAQDIHATKNKDDSRQRAIKALAIAKKLGGSMPNFKRDNEFFRGKKEIEYMKRLGNW